MSPKRNIAARVGGWSARHWKTAVFGWIAFVLVAFQLGGSIETKNLKQAELGVGESGHADRVYDRSYPSEQSEMVLLSSTSLKNTSSQFRAAVKDITARLSAVEGVSQVEDPYSAGRSGLLSETRNAVMLPFSMPGELESPKVSDTSKAAATAVAAAAKDHPGVRIESFGGANTEEALQKIFSDDMAKATTTSLPLTLILLLIAFGTLVAAGVPLLLAISGVLATLGLIGPVSQIAPVSDGITHVVLLIGLAVGVDYALFYLRRLREERAAGRPKAEAIEIAAATSGRSILVSGLTVMTAMAGMYLAGAPDFVSFATGTILVVAVSMIASLTVLPGLMSRLGDGLDRGRLPLLNRVKARMTAFGLWSRVVDRVMRRPLLWGGLTSAVLVALTIPAFSMQTGEPSTSTLPHEYPVVQTFDRLQAAFPTESSSGSIVIEARDVTSPAVAAGIERLQQAVGEHPGLFPDSRKAEVEISPDSKVATVFVGIAGDGTDELSDRALDRLRGDVVASTIGAVDGTRTSVNGQTATDRDFNDSISSHLPIVVGFVMSASFLLLLFAFRSIVVPLKAIALNLLSIGAAYGVMSLVFNHGWGKSLLGFEETGPITAWVPMFMFVILFGLSMDYHVFILSRVREAVDRGMETGDAVSYAIKNTAGVVTAAAVVMVAVFAIFGTLSFMMFKQMGVGLAFAVLLDATLIRGILLPASMKLLGERNWWLPQRLSWLPKLDLEPEVTPAKA
ncbi:MAG TPA: MMPL family transporter [Baekduia sp.]|nr:MMPL family transporter [Baekduia sp.]